MASGQPVARLRVGIPIAILLIVFATGCTGTLSGTPAPSALQPVTVILQENQFVVPPGGMSLEGAPVLTIPVGTTVTWENQDPVDHTATEYLDGFAKPDARFDLELAPGENASYTFDEIGTYEVGCVPHPAMQMLVIVGEP